MRDRLVRVAILAGVCALAVLVLEHRCPDDPAFTPCTGYDERAPGCS